MKLENILAGVATTVSVLAILPFVIIALLVSTICSAIYCRSVSWLFESLWIDVVLVWAIAKMVGRIFKTGEIKESIDTFYEETESL